MSVYSDSCDASSECSSIASNISEFSEGSSSYTFLRYEFIQGLRIDSKLLYTKDEKQFYLSIEKTKTVMLIYAPHPHIRIDKLCIQQNKYNSHRHEKKDKNYEELKVLNEIKEECTDITTLINEKKQSVRDIFYSVLSKYPEVKLDFYEHERGLQILRNSALPKNPVDCNDISNIFERADINNLLGTTKEGVNFFDGVLEGENASMCFFSSKKSIDLFEHVEAGERIIVMDGTFDCVPIGEFSQLLVIYGVYIFKVSEIGILIRFFLNQKLLFCSLKLISIYFLLIFSSFFRLSLF